MNPIQINKAFSIFFLLNAPWIKVIIMEIWFKAKDHKLFIKGLEVNTLGSVGHTVCNKYSTLL